MYHVNHRKREWRWEESDRGYETPCWIWLGCITKSGYGTMNNVYVHRFNFEAKYGPIPTGLQLDHKCRVRCCVNPAHLEIVTTRENTRRGINVKNTPRQVMEIRDLAKSGLFQLKEIGKFYGLARTTVSDIVHLRRWPD